MPSPSERIRRWAATTLLVIVGLSLWAPVVVAQHGCEAGNLIPNCNFDRFYGAPPRQLPQDFQPYVLSGSLDYSQAVDTAWGAPSLRLWSDGGTFHAGIFTQVGGLQPGTAYKASIGWGAPDPADSFGRRLGIDPTGGTDPNAPTVVWGPMWHRAAKILNYPPPNTNIDVSAVARVSTITVFVDVEHNYAAPPNWIFLDALSLVVDPNQPAPAPTATAAPPTTAPPTSAPAAVPTRVPPTQAPTITSSPSPSPTATVTATPTPTATATATATPTATPPPTDTPTPEPSATPTLPARPRATSGPRAVSNDIAAAAPGAGATASPVGLLWGGIGALGGAGVLGTALAMLRRK